MAGKKGVFVDSLGDIDELMPPPIPDPAESPVQETADDPVQETVDDVVEPSPTAPVEPVDTPRRPRRPRVAVSVPTAEVAPNVHRLLRRLTAKERTQNPITARTYAQVVLDAIEAHLEALSTYWTTGAGAERGGGEGVLFTRRPAAPVRRRRHADPPARVPLTGLNPEDAKKLDDLVKMWSAPSRSALVEQALRLYLRA